MSSYNTCRRCSIVLPEGRNYCDAHYREALDEYQEAYREYERNLSRWQRMSNSERNREHRRAENIDVGSNAIMLGMIIGGVAWFLLSAQIVWWMGCGLVVGVPFIIVKIPLLEQLVGRFARALFLTIKLTLAYGLIAFMISIFVESMQNNLSTVFTTVLVLSILCAFYIEMAGGNHASAAPGRPIRPEP